jgi:hypothetical protein
MHNLVLSPIDPEVLMQGIADKVTASIIEAVTLRTSTPSNTQHPEGYITETEASILLGGKNGKRLSKVTMWQLRKQNVLTSYRIGRSVRYKASEVLAAVAKIPSKK